MDWKRLSQAADKGEKVLAGSAVVVLGLIITAVCVQIIMRYFLNRPLTWVIEMTEYALLYVTFLGGAWLLKQGGHVRVDIITGLMNVRWKNRCAVFSSALGLFVSLVLTIFGVIVTYDYWARGMFKPTILEFPTWIVLLSIPLGSLFLGIRFLKLMIDHIHKLAQDSGSDRKER